MNKAWLKLLYDTGFLVVAVIISILIFRKTGFKFESSLSRATILIKIISMIALVALPAREYFNWTRNNIALKRWDGLIWLAMVTVCFTFLFIPLILTNRYALELFKSNTSFIGINLAALLVLFLSDRVIRGRLKENVGKKSIDLADDITYIDLTLKDTDPQKRLLEKIEALKLNIENDKASISFYNEIIWFADGAIVLALLLTYVLYAIIAPLAGIEMGNRLYQNFFDGATTFQLIISTVIYFAISFKHKVLLANEKAVP